MLNRTSFGILVGLALGFALVFASFGEMLIVALFGAIGYVVAKVLEDEFDLSRFVSDRSRYVSSRNER